MKKNAVSKVSVVVMAAMLIAIVQMHCAQSYQPLSWSDDTEQTIISLVHAVSTDTLYHFLKNIAKPREHHFSDYSNLPDIQRFILSSFSVNGYDTFSDTVEEYNGKAIGNLFAVKKGSETSLAPVIITAHWDAIYGFPGADDNASGCAALLEIARILTDKPIRRNVVLIIFAMEEDGEIGSSYYMERHRNQPPYILINLDEIAYTAPSKATYPLTGMPSIGNFIMIQAMERDRDFAFRFCDVIDHFVPQLPYYCMVNGEEMVNNPLLINQQSSDNRVFWQQNQPALFVNDFQNDNCHTPSDTIGTLDMNFFTNVTAATAAYVYTEALQ